MWLDESLPIQKRDLVLEQPFVNAAGTLGFAPDSRTLPVLAHLGAFITNPISQKPRQPAGSRAYLPYPGGFLLHTGLPNPGISRAISLYQRRWAAAPLPIIVHLLVEFPDTLLAMVRKLEGLENIRALELGIPPDCDPARLATLMDAAAGELPVILCLEPEQIPTLLDTVKMHQPNAVHLSQPRGTLPGDDGNAVTGRLYGPATFPVMLHALQNLINTELRVIANGGVFAQWQVQTLLEAGALAVSLGAVLWGVDPQNLFPNDR